MVQNIVLGMGGGAVDILINQLREQSLPFIYFIFSFLFFWSAWPQKKLSQQHLIAIQPKRLACHFPWKPCALKVKLNARKMKAPTQKESGIKKG